MRHVDEGTIHAWLDEQITDPAEAAWIEEHLRGCGGCRGRLADERATFDQAQMLLAEIAPSGERPSFEALIAKAGRSPGSETASATRMLRGRNERLLIQAGWAASIALAVGLGWTARELTDRDRSGPDAAPAIDQQSAATTAVPVKRAEAARPVAKPVSSTDVSNVPRADAPAPQRTATGSRAENTATPTAQPDALLDQARGRPSQTVPPAPPRAGAGTKVESGGPVQQSARSAPTAEATPAAAPPTAVAAPAAAARQEAITVTGEAATPGLPERRSGVPPAAAPVNTEWRSLPRTEAAARTGMPLYGIDGLEPVITALSADGTLVRTMYRLASGETVELVQERATPDMQPSVASIEATRRALAGAGPAGIVAGGVPSAQRRWSSVRGGVRVTLQTTSVATNLDELGTKLRVD